MGMGDVRRSAVRAGGEGFRAEVDGRVQPGGRGLTGSTGSPPHRPCAGRAHGGLTAALAVGGGGGAQGGVCGVCLCVWRRGVVTQKE